MKIVYLADGRSIHTLRWAKHFSGKGHSVHVVTFAAPSPSRDNILFHEVPLNWSKASYLLMRPYIERTIAEIKPDIIHGHYLTSYGAIAGRLRCNTPTILSAWGSDVLVALGKRGPYGAFLRRIVRPSLNKAESITAESTIVGDALRKVLHVPQSKIEVFPWGVDLSTFYPTKVCATDWTTLLSIPEGFRLVISPRMMFPVYNIEVIVKSIALVNRHFKNVMFVFLCGLRDQNYYAQVRRLVAQEGVSEHVRFIEEYLYPAQVAELLNLSQVLVSIPRSDSLPISVLEGLACNVLPVCNPIGANLEVMGEGVKMTLVEVDSNALGRSIIRVLERPNSENQVITSTNLKVVLEKYSWAMSCSRMEKLYQKALRASVTFV